MPKIFSFTRFSLRGLFLSTGPVVIVLVLACLLAYWLVDPAPPSSVTLSTGQENSAYEVFGKRYVQELAASGVKVELQPSVGSLTNLERLADPASGVDIAFVRSGSIALEQAQQQGLVSLGSLFTEPVWLFLREKKAVSSLTQLRGMKINVGPQGTGVPALFKALLALNGVEAEELKLGALEDTPATVALLEGQIDGLVFSSAPDAPLIQMLLQTPGIRLFDFVQAEAYTRRLPFLSHMVLPRGIVDLGRNIPARDYHLVAPTATLVARADLHPAMVDLFVQAATRIHGSAGWFQRRGEFPNANYTEIGVADQAQKFYRSGPPFLQRYLPFWLANLFDRMWVVVVALGALLLPLSRIVPPLYVWQVRSRVYRWYGQLRAVEQALDGVPREQREAVARAQFERLDEIEDRVNQIAIPLSFADELYRLRSHISFVRRRVAELVPFGDAPGTS